MATKTRRLTFADQHEISSPSNLKNHHPISQITIELICTSTLSTCPSRLHDSLRRTDAPLKVTSPLLRSRSTPPTPRRCLLNNIDSTRRVRTPSVKHLRGDGPFPRTWKRRRWPIGRIQSPPPPRAGPSPCPCCAPTPRRRSPPCLRPLRPPPPPCASGIIKRSSA